MIIAIELAIEKYNKEQLLKTKSEIDLEAVFVKSGHNHQKLTIEEILFIEASGSYSVIHTEDGKLTLSFNLHHFEEQTKIDELMRVHRSYIVNLKKVTALDKNTLYINNHCIPVSNAYKEKVVNVFQKL